MDLQNMHETLQTLRQTFRAGGTAGIEWRRSQLLALGKFLHEQEREIADAVFRDFGKSSAETFLTESGFIDGEIRYALGRLKKWMKPERVPIPLYYYFGKAEVQREPFGVVLIIGAWNYPLNICLAPLVSAIAAGNCAVVKPSEHAPCTSNIIAEGLSRYLDSSAFAAFQGGVEETKALLQERFDFICYTGSRQTGKEIMLAASRTLTPVLLELGGKCPCIVEHDANLRIAARRIVWAKFLNAGQTCIAPDYVLVHRDAEKELIRLMKEELARFYGNDPKASPDYPRIINERLFDRLAELIRDGIPEAGGDIDREGRYIAPAILSGVSIDAPLMQEEIFGPLLPVLVYNSLDEAISITRKNPDPLALYLFTSNSSSRGKVLSATRSGGFCSNDLLFQSAIHDLPFGGVGMSGFGRYHGKAGYEAFSYERSVLYRSLYPDPRLRYPPYGRNKFSLLRRIVTLFG
ncbi:MAG: aldehyde dehydrogenase family protein [Chlorobiaceae bacterium]|nr:aldehyde dehydrogenase family protein [Chlorobiaceae bacterium]